MDKYDELNIIFEKLPDAYEGDLNKFIEFADFLKNYLKSSKNKRFLMKKLLEHIFEQGSLISNSKSERNLRFLGENEECNLKYYDYYNTKESPYLLLYFQMHTCGENPTIKEFNEVLDYLILFYDNYKNVIKEYQQLITEEEIQGLLELPLAKKAVNIIVSEGQIRLLNINAKNVKLNSCAYTYTNVIVNSRVREEEDKSQVFLHELGHLLYGFLEKRDLVKDIEFDYVIKYAFCNSWDAIPEKDMLEIFADSFSVACASGTKFEKLNVLFKSTSDEKERIRITTYYFENLINRLSNYSLI